MLSLNVRFQYKDDMLRTARVVSFGPHSCPSLIEHHHRSQNSRAARQQAHHSKRSLQDAADGALRRSA
jgi:hypothetical protein